LKVIFLDIDGVMNSVRSFIATSRGKRKFDTIDEREAATIDPIAVALINEVVERTGAEIVVSSTHRQWFIKAGVKDIPGLRVYMKNLGIEKEILDCTDVLHTQRGHEIKDWLDRHAKFVIAYVIIDDDSDMLPEQFEFFIDTDCNDGFMFEHFIKAIEILKEKDNVVLAQVETLGRI